MTCAQLHELKTACLALLIPNVSTTGRRSSPSRPSPLGLTTGSWKPRDSGMWASATEVLDGRAKKAMHLGTTRYKCAAEPEWLITLVPVLDFVFSLLTNRMSRSLCLMPVPDISQSVWHQWKRWFFPSNISSFIQSEWNSKFGLEKKVNLLSIFLWCTKAVQQLYSSSILS